MAAADLAPIPDTHLQVIRLIGKTAQGRLAYAADAVVDGDLEGARDRAADCLARSLRSPLGLWPPTAPDTEVWVTETVERETPDDGTVQVTVTTERVATLEQLEAAPLADRRHRL
jgi:hypothetical protein